ncbi:hypothetical protein ACFY3U_27730 [Micromonospora sp. NPDC000089]|uniref:hypothetical protein n=1 Tax=unclassified Micromonospora TaxID=2617518 RepID=UPI00368538C9
MEDGNMITRRRLLKAGSGALAGLAAGASFASLDAAPASASAPASWLIDAAGYPVELSFSKKIGSGAHWSVDGGFAANTRPYGTSAWEPALAFGTYEQQGVDFCRLIISPGANPNGYFKDLEKIQIYRTVSMTASGPTGYWFEVYPPGGWYGNAGDWTKSSTAPWRVVSGYSNSGYPWDLPVDTERKWLLQRHYSSQPNQRLDWWRIYPDHSLPGFSTRMEEWHWYTPGKVRQSWMSMSGATALGVTYGEYDKYGTIAWDHGKRNVHFRRPLLAVRPLDRSFNEFEIWDCLDMVDAWSDDDVDEVSWQNNTDGYMPMDGSLFVSPSVWWRDGSARRFRSSDMTPTASSFWRSNAWQDDGSGSATYHSLVNIGNAAYYDRYHYPH